MSFEKLAEAAYNAFRLQRHKSLPAHKTPTPTWAELHKEVQDCWVASVRQVATDLQAIR